MKKTNPLSLAFLLLFPSLLLAKSVAVLEIQSSNDMLSSPERLYLTDVLRDEANRALPSNQDWTVMSRENATGSVSADYIVQAQISKFGSSYVVSTELHDGANNNLVASYTGKGATLEDIENIFKEQSPAFFQKLLETPAAPQVLIPIASSDGFVPVVETPAPVAEVPVAETPIAVADTAATTTETPVATAAVPATDSTAEAQLQMIESLPLVTERQAQPDTTQPATEAPAAVPVADTTQKQQPQVAEAAPKAEKAEPKAEEKKPEAEKAPAKKGNQPKRFRGGITAGITYNDFYSTKFGLDDIDHGKDISLSVSGADDLLGSYWGVGFKLGMSGMFVISPIFNLRSDLTLALRQGTGKTNASVILSKKKATQKEKSDLKIEYSSSQLNIDLPVLARVSIPKGIYFEAGPMLSFNVYSSSEVKITDVYGSEKFEEDGGLSAVEFDLVTGIGVSRNIGKSALDFDLRFVFGMTRISDANDSPKTWQGQLNVTYWFL